MTLLNLWIRKRANTKKRHCFFFFQEKRRSKGRKLSLPLSQKKIFLCVELTSAKMDHKYFINTNYLQKLEWRKEQLFRPIMRLLSQRVEGDDSSLSSLPLKEETSVMSQGLNNVSFHLHVRDERPQMFFEWNPQRTLHASITFPSLKRFEGTTYNLLTDF